MTMLLETEGLEAFYGDFQALFGIDVRVAEGETVALIGANGAGKSTFLRSITGMLPGKGQTIRLGGEEIAGWPADRIHKAGLALVPEGRRLFPSLSVEENLLIGASGGWKGVWSLVTVYELFPDLVAKKHNPGTALSGGQQQMVAIGRALMSNPKLLLCDEISLGLSPKVIKDIYALLPQILGEGLATILVEQDVTRALSVSDHFVCMLEGHVSLQGRSDAFTHQQISAAYFGT